MHSQGSQKHDVLPRHHQPSKPTTELRKRTVSVFLHWMEPTPLEPSTEAKILLQDWANLEERRQGVASHERLVLAPKKGTSMLLGFPEEVRDNEWVAVSVNRFHSSFLPPSYESLTYNLPLHVDISRVEKVTKTLHTNARRLHLPCNGPLNRCSSTEFRQETRVKIELL